MFFSRIWFAGNFHERCYLSRFPELSSHRYDRPPTGRLIQKREPYALDMDAVFEAAAGAHVLLEINAFPTRLDLTDVHCRRARTFGVTMGIGTDAHHTDHLGYLDLGVAVARRGWLERGDVVNTRSLAGIRSWLER